MPARPGQSREMKGRGERGSDQGAGKEDRPAATASDNNTSSKSADNPTQVSEIGFYKNICRKYFATFDPGLLSQCQGCHMTEALHRNKEM